MKYLKKVVKWQTTLKVVGLGNFIFFSIIFFKKNKLLIFFFILGFTNVSNELQNEINSLVKQKRTIGFFLILKNLFFSFLKNNLFSFL